MGNLIHPPHSFPSCPVGRHPVLEQRRLTTAEILYHLPDHPGLLQTFVWQCRDQAPDFPRLRKFLHYWSHNLDGLLHSVRVAQAGQAAGGRSFTAVDRLFETTDLDKPI